jgi:membrane protease YdiL (CAAX protease family)
VQPAAPETHSINAFDQRMTNDPGSKNVASSLRASTWTLPVVAGGLIAILLSRTVALLDRAWLSDLPMWITYTATFAAPLLFLLIYPLITRQQESPNTFRLPTARRLAKEAAIAIPLVFACLILSALVHLAITVVFPETPLAPQQIDRISRSTGSPSTYGFLLVAFSIGPLAEEVFFRGFLFNAFRRRMHLWSAITLQSAIFGFAHFYGVAHSIEVAILGLFFTLLYCWRQTIYSPIFVHAGYNAVISLVLFTSMLANANGPVLGVVQDQAAKTCVIADITRGSPAESAGLLAGDTITGVDDHPIENFNNLFDTLQDNYAPGDTVMIAVTRGDESLQVEVTLASRSSLPKRK